MKNKTLRRFYFFAIAGTIVIALFLFWHMSQDGENPEGVSESPLARAMPEAPKQRLTSNESAGPVAAEASVNAFAGFPLATAQDPIGRYAFAKECAKFRNFDEFYRAKASDPAWPLNNPQALAAADPELRSKLLKTSQFLDEHRQSCKAWLDVTSQDLENAQIYEATLQAARRGDQDAAACFVLAGWQKPSDRSPYYARLVKEYATNSRKFLQDALKVGHWSTVLAAYQAAQEQHGLQTSVGYSVEDAYLLARLAQLASPDAMGESQFGYKAANAARTIAASELIALDKRASELYAGQFKRAKVSVQSVTDMCVN